MIAPRTFGLQVGGALLVLGVLPALWGGPLRTMLVAWAVILIAAALFVPRSLGLLSSWWMAIGRALDAVVSPVLQRILYYGVLVPFAALVPREERVGWQPADGWAAPVTSTDELGLIGEIVVLLRTRRRLILLPMLAVLLVLGGLFLLTEGTALLPFLYPLF